MHDSVALWGKMQDKHNTKGFLQGRKIDRGGKKKEELSRLFYSLFISAEICLCTKIMHKYAYGRMYQHNPIICDTKRAKCV